MDDFEQFLNSDSCPLIGAWHIDYSTAKVRADGRCPLLFGVEPEKLKHGIALSVIDTAYTPEDLDKVLRVRRSLMAEGGRLHMQYKLIDAETRQLRPVHSLATVYVDGFGQLREARGLLFAGTDAPPLHAQQRPSYDDAFSSLVKAADAVQALGYPHLRTMLQVIFREVARGAIDEQFTPIEAAPRSSLAH